MDFTALFEKLQRDAIRVTQRHSARPLQSGASKIGGTPDLPPDFTWYTYTGKAQLYQEGKCTAEESAERPLSFLAQINLAELSLLNQRGRLPEQGMLYFFYEMATMDWGFEPEHRGNGRVYYYDGPMAALVPTEPPESLPPEYCLPELALDFSAQISLPSAEEVSYLCDNWDWEAYDKAREGFGCAPVDLDGESCRLLGYADVLQNAMQMECELASGGFSCGDGPGVFETHGQECFERSKEWKLLFQLGTVRKGEGYELTWGDGGYLYYYIKKSDLKNQDFSKVWVVLQCG